MGILTSVALSSVLGWIYLVALTSLLTDIPSLLDPGNDAGGYAVAQALYTAFRRRYGGGGGALLCLGVVAVTTFLCGSGCITTNSRMGYAFSRDGAMPFSRFLVPGEQAGGALQRRLALRRRGLRHGAHGTG